MYDILFGTPGILPQAFKTYLISNVLIYGLWSLRLQAKLIGKRKKYLKTCLCFLYKHKNTKLHNVHVFQMFSNFLCVF